MLNIIIDKKNLNPFIFNDIQFLSSLQKVTLENKEVLTFIDKLSGEHDAKITVSVNKIYIYERVFTCQ